MENDFPIRKGNIAFDWIYVIACNRYILMSPSNSLSF